MADDPKTTGMSSDRARRINSLHRSVDDIVQEQNKKRLQVSTEISSLTKEQQKLMSQLDAERGEFTNETAAAYNSVVKNLGQTIKNLSTGVKNITTDTAKASAGAINQYGKAIGEDISVNKQNTIAMAMARATPLFGYFAAKFMETDVFQDAATKMKEKVSGTLASAGESLANVFRKKGTEEPNGPPPKLQEGGYIKKGGVVEVHAAEIVSPIDKVMEAIDQGTSQKVLEELSAIHTILLNSRKQGEETQKALLKSVNELKASMIGTVSQLQITWQRTLLEHPTLKGMLTFGQTMQSVIETPFRVLFGVRGGFLGDVRRATRTNNIFQQQVNLLALLYTKGMTYLRNIEKYTHVTAEALVGEPVSPVTSKTYTLFGKIKDFMTGEGAKEKEGLFDSFVTKLKLDRSALKEAGINSFSDLLNPMAIIRNMGFTKANIKDRFGGFTEEIKKTPDDVRKMFTKQTPDKYKSFKKAQEEKIKYRKNVVDSLSSIKKSEEDREEREGPHSPSMAENIAATATVTDKQYKEDKKDTKQNRSIWEKIKDYSKDTKENMGGLRNRFRKMGKGLKSWIPIIWGFLSRIGGGIKKIVQPIINIAKWIGMFVATKSTQMLGKAGGLLGKAGAGVATAYKAGGVKGVALTAGRAAMVGGGAVAGAAAGGILGMGLGLWDVVQAIRNPDEWAAGVFTRAISGFLAGTGSGAKGAAWGAAKGAGLGAAVGLVGGPIGVAIGGALGAIAGGALGFVGGKDISKAIQASYKGIKEYVSVVWKIVRFPYDFLKEGIKSVYYITKWAGKKLYGMIDEWLSGPGIVGEIWAAVKLVFKSMFGAVSFLGSQISKWISSMFKDKDWTKILKQGIKDFFFPIPNLILAFKEIGMIIDEWMTGLPWGLGTAYRWAKKYTKKISGGTLSRSLKDALEMTTPEEKSAIQLDHTGALARNYAQQEASRNASREAAAIKAAEASNKAGEARTQAWMNQSKSNTNTMVSTINNSSNTNIAPGDRSRSFVRNANVDNLLFAAHQ